MAHGRPVVVTRVGGLVDLEGPGALLVPPRDPAALRAALEELLADGALRARLAGEARARADGFSRAAETRGLLDAYSA
jgi:glycosyltransferase involved in cell wall biosynthesis